MIRILDIAGGADTQTQGDLVYGHLVKAFAAPGQVIVSFDGIDIVTSSFLNVTFSKLLATVSFDEIKARLKVIKSTRQINTMLRRRLTPGSLVPA